MNKGMKAAFGGLALAAVLGFSGCGETPDADVQAARGAIETARKLGAEQAAQKGLWEATHYLDSALQEIDKQKKKFFAQDYSQARSLLQTAGEKAREAGVLALKAGEEAKAAAAKAAAAAKDSVSAKAAPSAAAAAQLSVANKAATKAGAESAINLTYAKYQRTHRVLGASATAKPVLENAMRLLKEARNSLKSRDYAGAVRTAQQVDGLLDSLTK